jgi:hypothetical protein
MRTAPVIPAIRKLSQEDCEFKASFGYIIRLCQGGEKEGWREGERGRKGKEKKR